MEYHGESLDFRVRIQLATAPGESLNYWKLWFIRKRGTYHLSIIPSTTYGEWGGEASVEPETVCSTFKKLTA